ncbi:hypothetical protein LINGRAHAP2_LOCUS33378 [Linum grandiflorum]
MGFKQLLLDGCPEPKVGEARAILEGVRWASEAWVSGNRGGAIVGNLVHLTEFGVITDACKVRLATQPNFTVMFKRKTYNGVAIK